MENNPSTNQESGFHLFGVRLLEDLIEFIRGLMTVDLLDFCTKWLTLIGHYAVIAAAGLGFLFSFIYAMRSNNFRSFLFGIGWVLIIFVAQYTAHKFIPAGKKLIQNNPTKLSSKAFLNCLAFLAVAGGLVILIMGIVQAAQSKSWTSFYTGVGAFVLLEFVALVSFNPKTITVDIVPDNSAGQEAIGIITFFIKALMRLVPIFFGAGVALGTVMLFISSFGLFGGSFDAAFVSGKGFAKKILGAALIPFLSYLFFSLLYLIIDLIQSVLSIPEKFKKS